MFGQRTWGLCLATTIRLSFVAIICLGLTANTQQTAANTLSLREIRAETTAPVLDDNLPEAESAAPATATLPLRLGFATAPASHDFPAEVPLTGLNRAQAELAHRVNASLRQGNLGTARKLYLKATEQDVLAGSWRADLEAALAAGFFYRGQSAEDHKQARSLANASGTANQPLGLWIAGLAAWRVQDYADAARNFTRLAEHPALDDGRWAAAHFWAYRSLAKLEDRKQAGKHLAAAARLKGNFYALLATALMADPETLDQAHLLDNKAYAPPRWQPRDGFTTDRALIYALMRHESNLNPNAISPRGAAGLMQLMPATAVSLCTETDLAPAALAASGRLFEPEYNLHLGQAYVRQLAAAPQIDHNLVLLLAAYNAGPNKVREWLANRPASDPLLFMESLPLRETRNYVERVLPHYWAYRVALGQPLTSLRHLAAGVAPRLDSDPKPARLDSASLPAMQARAGLQLASR
jgi:soluble lytic murein transglycosylase-like protein